MQRLRELNDPRGSGSFLKSRPGPGHGDEEAKFTEVKGCLPQPAGARASTEFLTDPKTSKIKEALLPAVKPEGREENVATADILGSKTAG